jgi:hypothetical protein
VENIKSYESKNTTKSTDREVFEPYYMSYNSRAEYEQAISDAYARGDIVKIHELPRNAARYWGESSNESWGSILYNSPPPESSSKTEDDRKNELYNQINSL